LRGKVWFGLNITMLVAFVLSVIVQFNDPDPFIWMPVYGAAAVACGLELAHKLRWWFPALVGVGSVVWAVTIASHVFGQVPFLEMFGAWEMKDTGVEESREMYGLLIVAGWMVVLTIANRRSGKHIG
jgi:hypothetical protein